MPSSAAADDAVRLTIDKCFCIDDGVSLFSCSSAASSSSLSLNERATGEFMATF